MQKWTTSNGVSTKIANFSRAVICMLVVVLCAAVVSLSAPIHVNAGGGTSTPAPAGAFKPIPEPKQQAKLDKATIQKIDLKSYPIVPNIPDYAKVIYEEGRRRGLNASVFSKEGDCMTATDDFMAPIAKGNYDLDQYTSLKVVINKYLGVPARTPEAGLDSFSNPGLAAASGFNAAGILDSTWSDPKWCTADETPLDCEYRVSKPSIAFIMFGTNDIKSITAEQFDYYLRMIVVQTINAGVVPVLSTFPMQPGLTDNSIYFNQITVKIATDYNIPLINLWLALDPLPNKGIDPVNTTHMTKPASGKTGSFAKDDLQYGYNMRNLVTLQSLEALLKVVDPASLTEKK